jgi:hypothetical protein
MTLEYFPLVVQIYSSLCRHVSVTSETSYAGRITGSLPRIEFLDVKAKETFSPPPFPAERGLLV